MAAAIGLREIHIKREDISGYALGGNKLRQLYFILAGALEVGADMLITTAGSQSNFCRCLAGAAAKLVLGCHLHLRENMRTERVGNLMLDQIFGAKCRSLESCNWIADTSNQAADRLGFETRLTEDDFDIIDTEI